MLVVEVVVVRSIARECCRKAPMFMNTFVQVINPAAFGGDEAFTRQTSFFAASARQSPPVPGGPAVRTPGEAALKHKAEAEAHGLAL